MRAWGALIWLAGRADHRVLARPGMRRLAVAGGRAGRSRGLHGGSAMSGSESGRNGGATAASRVRAGFELDVRYTSIDLQIYLRLVESGLVREAACHLSLAGHRRLPTPGRPARASPCPILSRQAKIRNVEARVIALQARGDHGR